jgi:hypothetical protein
MPYLRVRGAAAEDPFGHVWRLNTRIEAVTPREMKKRLDKVMAEPTGMVKKKAKAP